MVLPCCGYSARLLLAGLVLELGHDAFELCDVLPRAQINRLIEGIAFPEGVEIADLHYLTRSRHFEARRNGDVAHRNPAVAIEQPQFDAPLVVDLRDHGRTGGVELVFELS